MKNLKKTLLRAFLVMLSVMLLNVSAFADRYAVINNNYSGPGLSGLQVHLWGTQANPLRYNSYSANSGNGGAFLIEEDSNLGLDMYYGRFNSNTAANGGAVAQMGSANAWTNFQNTGFDYNSATNGSGGAVYIADGVVEVFAESGEECWFYSNKSTEKGGAIYNDGELHVGSNGRDDYDIKFCWNEAGTYGGAIYNSKNAETRIYNHVDFSTNTAKSEGGAIYNEGKMSIGAFTTFQGNQTKYYGGAIYNSGGELTIGRNTLFSLNKSTHTTNGRGGAIYNYNGSVTISSVTRFNENYAREGGAIYNTNGGTFNIDNYVYFSSNTSGTSGGAIYNHASSTSTFTIGNYVTFNNNNASATNSGGAIYNYDSKMEIGAMSRFEGNSAGYGGAVYHVDRDNVSTMKIGNSSYFINNTATSRGGAIYSDTDDMFTLDYNIYFMKNTAGDYGGAIENTGNFTTGSQIHFSSNTATNKSGGAIANLGGNFKLGQSDFYGNTAKENGGAIHNDKFLDTQGTVVVSTSSTFIKNTVQGNGGAIYNTGLFNVYQYVKFSTNTADGSGGAIANMGGNFTLGTFLNFYGNIAKENGGAIYNDNLSDTDGTVVVSSQATFTKNTAQGKGGAIYNTGIFNAYRNVNFSTNTAKGSGGAIYNGQDGNVNISDYSKFFGNSSWSTGGAIQNEGKMSIAEFAIFQDNKAKYYGGAISNSGKLTIGRNTRFSLNKSTDTTNGRGGAIYNNNGSVTIDTVVKFNENYAAREGGAIYNTSGGNFNIAASVEFSSNTSGTAGGAIYNGASSTSTFKIDINARFHNNNASVNNYGGAIFNSASKMEIGSMATFEVNSAGYGGAIAHFGENENGTMKVGNSSRFINNSAASRGGAIYSDTDDMFTLGNNIYFMKNTAGDYGGAIENSGNFTAGNGIEFSSNTATNKSGGAISNLGGTFSLGYNAKFYGNIAKEKGGAIHNDKFVDTEGTFFINSGTTFTKNRAQEKGGAIHNGEGRITIAPGVIFSSNAATAGNGGAIYNAGSITVGNNGKFIDNLAEDGGGAIYNDNSGTITIGNNAIFTGNTSNFSGAIYNDGTITFVDGAVFRDNAAEIGDGGAILNNGTLDLIANTCYVEFTGNTSGGDSIAICSDGGTTNLWVSEKSYMMFNDKIIGDNLSVLNINQSSGTRPTNGIINLNADMSDYKGTLNFYNGTIELKSDGKWFGGDLVVENSPTINMANNIVDEHNFNNLTINGNLQLSVDADLENGEMDTISATSFGNNSGKITVNRINILSDIDEKETVEIEFADNVLKNKVASVNKASSLLYNYTVRYDKQTGCFKFMNGLDGKTKNMGTVASAVSASAGGYATQSVVANQVFASMDGKVSKVNKASADPSNLYVSAGDQVFDNSGTIERGLWLKPFVAQETVKIGEADVDNSLYGTLAGIDFPVGQDKQVSFYLGYAGSKQEVEEVKSNQTGYVLGATGMIIKDKWYAGLTANVMFNKASIDTDFGTDDVDMNMFSIGAKAGYNYDMGKNWILEPNLTLMYGIVNSGSYETSQGAEIDSQSVSNILVEPQVKAKLQMNNGWQPYGLLGYAANLSSKPTVKVEGMELELDSIDGYIEYGAGVNKDFIGTVWSCYAQVTGRSGGRNGFAGNLGVKYKF